MRWLTNPQWRPSDPYFDTDVDVELRAALEDQRPDVIVTDHLYSGGYLDALDHYRATANKPVIVIHNSHNLEVDIVRQIASTERSIGARVARKTLAARTKSLEADMVNFADALWVCSDDDLHLFDTEYQHGKPTVVVPNVVDVDTYDPTSAAHLSRTKAEPKNVIFPASFAWPPNIVAAAFLVDEVLPKLAGDVRIVLAGSGASDDLIASVANEPRAALTGFVADMRTHLRQADAMMAPLFEGGGTRLKALEAFAAGIPLIATRKAVEGLAVEDEVHLLLAETPAEFASALQRLDDEHLRSRLVTNGRQLVEREYSVTNVETAVRLTLSQLHAEQVVG
jgi:glycosyltransferase involved in cell wall biosynthesis